MSKLKEMVSELKRLFEKEEEKMNKEDFIEGMEEKSVEEIIEEVIEEENMSEEEIEEAVEKFKKIEALETSNTKQRLTKANRNLSKEKAKKKQAKKSRKRNR